MKVPVLFRCISICALLLVSAGVEANKWPSVPCVVKMVLRDWHDGKPIEGASALVFVNGANEAANNGYRGEFDIPNLSVSKKTGNLDARTLLYRGGEKIEIRSIEVILMKSSYRSERFVFGPSDLEVLASPDLTTIRVKEPIRFFRTQKQ